MDPTEQDTPTTPDEDPACPACPACGLVHGTLTGPARGCTPPRQLPGLPTDLHGL